MSGCWSSSPPRICPGSAAWARASNARVAIVAIDEDDPDKSAKLFSALEKSNPGLNLVAVARHISQELLLDIMRAGAP